MALVASGNLKGGGGGGGGGGVGGGGGGGDGGGCDSEVVGSRWDVDCGG